MTPVHALSLVYKKLSALARETAYVELALRAQRGIIGHRLIGEFVRQWLFILGGFGVAAHLGLRLSRSTVATSTMMAIALLVLAVTPIYHHDKLFFFPLIVWVCWRYIDHPTAGHAALCGCVTAIAFLFRHDYGVYLGAASIGAFLLARIPVHESRGVSAAVRDG